MTNQEKAHKFLQYVAENEKELKKNLAKNISYNSDIFDDVFNESIMKAFSSILKNGTEINDYKQYFFIVSKFTYIYYDNKNKKKNNIEVNGLFDNNDFDIMDSDKDEKEEQFINTINALDSIKNHLITIFGEHKAEIYLTYISLKSQERTSYKKIAAEFNMSAKEVSNIVSEIKRYIDTSDTIKEIKKEYYDL